MPSFFVWFWWVFGIKTPLGGQMGGQMGGHFSKKKWGEFLGK